MRIIHPFVKVFYNILFRFSIKVFLSIILITIWRSRSLCYLLTCYLFIQSLSLFQSNFSSYKLFDNFILLFLSFIRCLCFLLLIILIILFCTIMLFLFSIAWWLSLTVYWRFIHYSWRFSWHSLYYDVLETTYHLISIVIIFKWARGCTYSPIMTDYRDKMIWRLFSCSPTTYTIRIHHRSIKLITSSNILIIIRIIIIIVA